jgi:putative transposase
VIKTDARTTVERPAPSNKLSEAEVRAVLDACHRPDTAHLPPTQIVPRPADKGVYLGEISASLIIKKRINILQNFLVVAQNAVPLTRY